MFLVQQQDQNIHAQNHALLAGIEINELFGESKCGLMAQQVIEFDDQAKSRPHDCGR